MFVLDFSSSRKEISKLNAQGYIRYILLSLSVLATFQLAKNEASFMMYNIAITYVYYDYWFLASLHMSESRTTAFHYQPSLVVNTRKY